MTTKKFSSDKIKKIEAYGKLLDNTATASDERFRKEHGFTFQEFLAYRRQKREAEQGKANKKKSS